MNRIVKTVVWFMMAAFVAQDIAWANPDMGRSVPGKNTLQIPLMTGQLRASDVKALLEKELQEIVRSISLSELKKRVYNLVVEERGIRFEIKFRVDSEGRLIADCSVLAKIPLSYSFIVNDDFSISLVEYNSETPKSLDMADASGAGVDGFIQQGLKSWKKFVSRLGEIRKNEIGKDYRHRLIPLLESVLKMPEIGSNNREILKKQLERFNISQYKIYGFEGIIEGHDDFSLGHDNMEQWELFLATDLIKELEIKGTPTLVDEYLLHELLCPILGHNVSILIQQKIFPMHYPDAEKLSKQASNKPYKGLLGVALREEINMTSIDSNALVHTMKEEIALSEYILKAFEQYAELISALISTEQSKPKRAVSYHYLLDIMALLDGKMNSLRRMDRELKKRFYKEYSDGKGHIDLFSKGQIDALNELDDLINTAKKSLEKLDKSLGGDKEKLLAYGKTILRNPDFLDSLRVNPPAALIEVARRESALRQGKTALTEGGYAGAERAGQYEDDEWGGPGADSHVYAGRKAHYKKPPPSRSRFMKEKSDIADLIIDFDVIPVALNTEVQDIEKEAAKILEAIRALRRIEVAIAREKHGQDIKVQSPVSDGFEREVKSMVAERKAGLNSEKKRIKEVIDNIKNVRNISDLIDLANDGCPDIAEAANAELEKLREELEAKEKERVKKVTKDIKGIKEPSCITRAMLMDRDQSIRKAAKTRLKVLENQAAAKRKGLQDALAGNILESADIEKPEAPNMAKEKDLRPVYFLRNIVDTEELSQNMIEGILSALFSNKKLTLAFSRRLKGLESARMRALMRQLSEWKEATVQKNRKMKSLLDNFTILEYDDLKAELVERNIDINAKDSLIFTYAPKPQNESEDTANFGSAIRPVYIIEQEEGFPENYYYPLLEMVTVSLAKELLQWDERQLREALAASNIDIDTFGIDTTIDEKLGILIFKVLPKMERYENDSRIDRYTRLMQFLRSA